jgi:cellobiose-specific phosphotransferase system component IIB
MAQVSVDVLEPRKSLIDLDSYGKGNFGLDDYVLSFIFDDILLVEYVDEVNDGQGDAVMRDGVFVPTNALIKAWRKAKVILTGPGVKYVKKGDIVLFPHDKGVAVANVNIEGHGRLKKGVFLNEQRLFGICKLNTENEDNVTSSGSNTKRKRL